MQMQIPELANVIIKHYPNFTLLAKIKKDDLEEYEKTKDKSLLLYRFCESKFKTSVAHDYEEIKKQASASRRLDRKQVYW